MTRDAAIKHKEVIEAFINGADVEYFDYDRWLDAPTPQFDLRTEYRIKPKEELVPLDFSDAERLIGKVVKSKDGTEYGVISNVDEVSVSTGKYSYTYSNLMDVYEFLNGSPIGKLAK